MAFRYLIIALLLSTVAWTGNTKAEPTFPELTGRVVDQADLLPSLTESQLTRKLAEHEKATSNQVVVVTLPSLQGYTIEDFGYQLGRHWGIGQAEKDNGVLLIVAPNERKVRIEVGYGLEGKLTDALSHNIIQTKILPNFRQNHYDTGIVQGTDAILAALQGTYKPTKSTGTIQMPDAFGTVLFIFVIGIIAGEFFSMILARAISAMLAWVGIVIASGIIAGAFAMGFIAGMFAFLFILFMGAAGTGGGGYGGYYDSGSGYSGGSWSSGGFSGGGGSFGGGGASGSW